MASAAYGDASEFSILVGRAGKSNVRASEFAVLVVIGPPPSLHTQVSETRALVSAQKAKVMAEVSEITILVSYVSKGVERFDQRSWGFTFDQHQFYVLHLGSEGTFVYDVLSSEWAQWETQGFDQWNAEAGIEWNDGVYFGDNSLPTLWRLDPDSFLDDDFRPIKRIVTGGIPANARETIRSGLFVLSAEKQSELDTEGTPYVQLSLSDDGGDTWNDREALSIADTVRTQDLSWRGLGIIRAPGRVFKITDESGVVTIKGADQAIVEDKPRG